MKEPHEFVLDKVRKKWKCKRLKRLWRKLIGFIFITPTAIEIIQTKSFNKKNGYCTGEDLQRWWFNDEGLRSIPLDLDTCEELLEYCWYCIDIERKRLAIVWANILPSAIKRKKIHYFHNGVVYKIIDEDDVENYEPVNIWKE